MSRLHEARRAVHDFGNRLGIGNPITTLQRPYDPSFRHGLKVAGLTAAGLAVASTLPALAGCAQEVSLTEEQKVAMVDQPLQKEMVENRRQVRDLDKEKNTVSFAHSQIGRAIKVFYGKEPAEGMKYVRFRGELPWAFRILGGQLIQKIEESGVRYDTRKGDLYTTWLIQRGGQGSRIDCLLLPSMRLTDELPFVRVPYEAMIEEAVKNNGLKNERVWASAVTEKADIKTPESPTFSPEMLSTKDFFDGILKGEGVEGVETQLVYDASYDRMSMLPTLKFEIKEGNKQKEYSAKLQNFGRNIRELKERHHLPDDAFVTREMFRRVAHDDSWSFGRPITVPNSDQRRTTEYLHILGDQTYTYPSYSDSSRRAEGRDRILDFYLMTLPVQETDNPAYRIK
ncbi:MAG: hypothetical protein M1450_03575 [Patescibacteria group bacterium]|nr:hypothetical protein [Patescibacteria group bacterium]